VQPFPTAATVLPRFVVDDQRVAVPAADRVAHPQLNLPRQVRGVMRTTRASWITW
jgi:hypothetical protein